MQPKSVASYRQYVANLVDEFGGRLICDIGASDIATLQRKRLAAGKAARTVNYEIHTLRGILKHFNLWSQLADQVKNLRERHNVGRAISSEDERKLLDVIGQSPSPALLPLFLLCLDTGLRKSEARLLRRNDLALTWERGVITGGELIVGKSKTDAGAGRVIPLTKRVCALLSLWLSRFPDGGPDSYVFPRHRVGFARNAGSDLYEIDLTRPMGEWKTAWRRVRRLAGLDYRWHDSRHTLVSRLAENPNVSEETIRALAGHVSKQMLQRYSHIRAQAKRDAISTLERHSEPAYGTGGAQNWAQPAADRDE
ncbi:MAG: tyrosine-type recombinase/integrase [Candidatus Binataceae bacterium]